MYSKIGEIDQKVANGQLLFLALWYSVCYIITLQGNVNSFVYSLWHDGELILYKNVLTNEVM